MRPSHEQVVQNCFPDSCINHVDFCGEDILTLPHGTLVNEIQLLIKERGILRNKMRENSDSSRQELQQFRQNSTLEIERLRNEDTTRKLKCYERERILSKRIRGIRNK